jgi:putative membrane protein
MTTIRITAAALAALAFLSTAALAGSKGSPDAKFLSDAIQTDIGEVNLGQLAQQRFGNAAVKSFGWTLVSDHSQARMDAAALANSMQAKVPISSGKNAKQAYKKMKSLSGTPFDQSFLAQVISDLQGLITETENETKSSNAPVAALAQKQLPMLQNHLATAQSLQKQIGMPH